MDILIHAFDLFIRKLTFSDICRIIDLYFKLKDHTKKK